MSDWKLCFLQKQKYKNKGIKKFKSNGNKLNKNKLKQEDESGELVSLGISGFDDGSTGISDVDDANDEDAPQYASVTAGEIETLSDVDVPTACPKGELSDLLREEFEENTSEMDSRYIRYTITPVMGCLLYTSRCV